jgi:hypothetical protein
MQTKISHTGQCMENMVGMVAHQYRVLPSPAGQGWADMLVLCHGSTFRNSLPTLCRWVYQIVCHTRCSTYIYLSLFVLALLEMISFCMTSWLLKNIFRFTFPLEQSWQHSIFHGDCDDFNWFNLHLAMSHHPQVKWDPDICSLPWCCPSKRTENHVWHTLWHQQIINLRWHGSFYVILALLW